jgi:muramoyltetrapeptide carboxypeptidase
MSKWNALQPGDLIDVIAPGSRCSDQELESGVKTLESWGYRVRVDSKIFGPDVICSNTDEERFRQLKKALTAKDSKAVWCARGGYGAIRFTEELKKLKKPSKTKLLIGYSDITTIHHLLNQFWSWPSLHGPLLDRVGRGDARPDEVSELKAVLRGEKKAVHFSNLIAMNKSAQKKSTIKATVSGGNLMVANSTLGGVLQKPFKGIVFLEDRGERGYRVDRLLKQMELAGSFKQAKAIVFGDFIGGLEADGKDMVTPILERFAHEMKIPVFKGVEAGHGDKQRPVFFNTPAILTGGASASLNIQTGVAL